MHSIGNDIVDLNLAKTQSNWLRKGFLEKQFTMQEQKIILSSNNPFEQVWLFWSMKEAAYKCYTQDYPKRFFAPKKFSCQIINSSLGVVQIASKKYHVKYFITNDYVYSEAQEHKSVKMVSELFYIDNQEHKSKNINSQLLSYFKKDVQLIKNKIGVPFLYQDNIKLPHSISTTHHGNYGAFTISNL